MALFAVNKTCIYYDICRNYRFHVKVDIIRRYSSFKGIGISCKFLSHNVARLMCWHAEPKIHLSFFFALVYAGKFCVGTVLRSILWAAAAMNVEAWCAPLAGVMEQCLAWVGVTCSLAERQTLAIRAFRLWELCCSPILVECYSHLNGNVGVCVLLPSRSLEGSV